MIYIVWLNKSETFEPDRLVAAGAYPGFCSMREASWSISTPPGRDTSPLQVTPRQIVLVSLTIHQYPFIDPGWREAL